MNAIKYAGMLTSEAVKGDSAMAMASPNRIRLTLLRIGAVVLRNARCIRLLLSSACPYQGLFRTVAVRLDTS